MNTNPNPPTPTRRTHLIVAQDEEVDDRTPSGRLDCVRPVLGLALIVFLQFFTRYVLNDSLSWTEEIARYGLMWLAFIGGAVVTRKNTHIAVELVSNLMRPGLRAPRCWRRSISSRSAFSALLAYFSVTIIERMHYQRMTVFEVPMSVVYGGVGFGCFMMWCARSRSSGAMRATAGGGPTTSPNKSSRLKAGDRCRS